MNAQVGDELIIESPQPGAPGRIGTIVALQNTDGSPPYVVHWLAGDYVSQIDPARWHGSKGTTLHSRRRLPAGGGCLEAAVSVSASGRSMWPSGPKVQRRRLAGRRARGCMSTDRGAADRHR
jgi:hypothetical protein